jgi:hypothetical protein
MKKGMMVTLILFLGLLVGGAKAAVRWHLDFEPVKVDRISIKTGAEWQAYWYFMFKVTNNTEETQRLRLGIKAFSDVADKTYLEGYYKRVEAAVEKREGKDLANIKDLRCTLEPGESKEGLAIFGSISESTDLLKIQILGLWDRISHEGPKIFVEDRALVLTYSRPGDEYYPQYDKIVFKRKDWKVLSRKEK